MKRVIRIGSVVVTMISIYLVVKSSIPYKEAMQTRHITIDSIVITGGIRIIFLDDYSRKGISLPNSLALPMG